MDLNKPIDLEQYHEELSIMRHLEKMDPSNNPKQSTQEKEEESK
ncbi:hypothetical protein [Fodinisporobacter ferrooxydans]